MNGLFSLDENRCPIKQSKGGTFPLHIHALQGSISGIQGFISAEVDVNCRDKQERTPLHEACCNRRSLDSHKLEIAKLLVSNGADPCALDNLEETPLHCVARHRVDRDIASFLVLQCKVPLTCLNLYGQTPLDVAKESSFSIYERCDIRPDVLTPKVAIFSLFPPVLQFLILEENRSNFTLRNLSKQTIYNCISPYENEKVDRLPLPSRLKCYVGGITYVQWMKEREVPPLATRVRKCNIL